MDDCGEHSGMPQYGINTQACHSMELVTAAKMFYDTVPRWNWLSARLFALKVEDEERKNLSFFI